MQTTLFETPKIEENPIKKPEMKINLKNIALQPLTVDLKQLLFSKVLEIFTEFRSQDRRILRYSWFKSELRRKLGNIVEDQLTVILNFLLIENYVHKDPLNVVDITCKLTDEYLKFKRGDLSGK